ncbi:TPA: N-acetyltransferase family protein, partial [Yersinia enterocolitica]
LGRELLEKMIQYTRSHGLTRLTAVTMPNNRGMIGLAKKLGFSIDVQMEDGIVNLELAL